MLLIIQNDSRVPAGVFGEMLQEKNIPFQTVHLYAGETLPPPGEAAAVIVLGGYMGVHDEAQHPFLRPLKDYMRAAAESGIPLLGICLGGQLLAHVLDGQVRGNDRGEKGVCEIRLTPAAKDDPLFADLPRTFSAFQWHNDSFDIPPGAVPLASSSSCPGQAFRYRNAWGVQFHPEVDESIVRSWSAASDLEGRHAASFRESEAALLQLSRHLLENFLHLMSS